jgi:DNA-binding Xre family transcriptional regulator
VLYDKIESIRKEKKIPKMDFYAKIDMTSKGYALMVENNSIKVATLQKIADALEVPIGVFFEQGPIMLADEPIAEDLDTPGPFDPGATDEVMALDVSLEQKIVILREMVGILTLQVRMLKKMSQSKDLTIQKLRGLS